MGHCAHGKSGLCLRSGVECYQDGLGLFEENMPFARYKKIIDECRGRTFQVALGGRGDPDMHGQFPEILKYTRENGVVPNFTTSGFGLDERLIPDIKKYCGAVAVSWYRNEYTVKALNLFLSAGIKTNIHYCLSNGTIDEAIRMIERKQYPEKINRVIFLLHKPVGLGRRSNVLRTDDERVKRFFSLFDRPETVDKAGFDSCSVPALLAFSEKLHPMCIEACEAGRFSAYVSPDYRLFPCSFEKDPYFGVSLENSGIECAWNSEPFQNFRTKQRGKCPGCPQYALCFGGCPIVPEITLCDSKHRSF
jgi:radical SAM protein with 4Fe4S-binding SPASM domain